MVPIAGTPNSFEGDFLLILLHPWEEYGLYKTIDFVSPDSKVILVTIQGSTLH